MTKPPYLVDQRDVEAIRKQAFDDFTNITRSIGFLLDAGRTFTPPAKAYQWALDNALVQVQSGAISYNEAITNAIRQLADSGIKTVDYESGHVDSVDVAVRRAVMSGVNRLNQQYREQSADYLETDLVEVTAHIGARDIGDTPENHKLWQGKVYRWAAKPQTSAGDYPDFEEVCGYGLGEGIGGWNCRHSFYPFIEGVSERTYTDEQLENIDPPPFEFDGKTYSAYEATQMQRRIERSIRKQKRRKAAFEAAGLTNDAAAAGSKLRMLNKKYKDFSAAAGLPEQRERMRVLYADDVPKTVANSGESGIINNIGYVNQQGNSPAIPKEYQGNYDDFDSLSISTKERAVLRELNRLSLENNYEYGQVNINGTYSDPFTSGQYGRVRFDESLTSNPNTNLYHSHTNTTCLSAEDMKFLTNQNIESVSVATINGDAFVVRVGDGDRPSAAEYDEVIKRLHEEANFSIIEHPMFSDWTLEEKTYMAIREQAYLIARYFKWNLEGGKL